MTFWEACQKGDKRKNERKEGRSEWETKEREIKTTKMISKINRCSIRETHTHAAFVYVCDSIDVLCAWERNKQQKREGHIDR